MGSLLLARVLICLVAVGRGTGARAMADPNLRRVSEEMDACPQCDTIFTMLETDASGERAQHIDVVERGEPKSGTTFMYHWAHGALVHSCNYLKHWFGGDSCLVRTGTLRGMYRTPEKLSLIFDPRLGGDGAKCSCDGVDSVEISVTDYRKHNLPVSTNCKWQHSQGIARGPVDCASADGKPAENYDDIARCLEHSGCEIKDTRRQFVVMRDPRPGAVSTYFHEQLHNKAYNKGVAGSASETLDEFVLAMVPVLCQWLALRYLLFTEIMGPQSTVFWYDDSLDDAFQWHSEWVASVGLRLPAPVVEVMADAALREDFDFATKGKNRHPGVAEVEQLEEKHTPTWQEVLQPETLVALDAIARNWLPPAVLLKLNILDY